MPMRNYKRCMLRKVSYVDGHNSPRMPASLDPEERTAPRIFEILYLDQRLRYIFSKKSVIPADPLIFQSTFPFDGGVRQYRFVIIFKIFLCRACLA